MSYPSPSSLLLVSFLIVGLSYGARNALSYTRCMKQNFLAFRDSPVIPFRRSPFPCSAPVAKLRCSFCARINLCKNGPRFNYTRSLPRPEGGRRRKGQSRAELSFLSRDKNHSKSRRSVGRRATHDMLTRGQLLNRTCRGENKLAIQMCTSLLRLP